MNLKKYITELKRRNVFKASIAESYQLKISGAVDNPASFTLEELGKLEMVQGI